MVRLLPMVCLLFALGCEKTAEQNETQTTQVLHVPTISCENCAGAVRKTLVREPGVMAVEVDVETKLVTVRVKESIFDSAKAIQALEKDDFPGAELQVADSEAEEPAS